MALSGKWAYTYITVTEIELFHIQTSNNSRLEDAAIAFMS